MFDRIRWISALVALLCATACDHDRGAADYWRVESYKGTWEYRYGELPTDRITRNQPAGGPALERDEGWFPADKLDLPPGRGGAETLWLRTCLHGPPLAKPMVSLSTYNANLQAYLDGRLIFDTQPSQRFSTAGFLPLVSLEHDYQGRWLVLRIRAQTRFIGLVEAPLLGEDTAVLSAWIRRGTPLIVLFVLFFVMAFASTVLAVLRRQESTYFYFAGLSFAAGLMSFVLTRLPPLWISLQLRWGPIGVVAALMVSFFLVSYIRLALGNQSQGLLIWVSRLSLVLLLVVSPLTLARVVPIDRGIAIALLENFIVSGFLAPAVLKRARRGDIDARILGVGFLLIVGVLLGESAAKLTRIIPSSSFYYPHGLGFLVLAGGVVEARRYAGVHQRVIRLAIESSLAQQRLSAQSGLLQAAARMADGDLTTEIAIPIQADLLPMSNALDKMRKSIAAQMQSLRDKNVEVQRLNEELRRQIEQRSSQLMKLMAHSVSGGASKAQALHEGQLLGERYRVVRLLGQGAMGRVYEVKRTTDGVRLAAKLMTDTTNRMALLRFVREARILAHLSHPNLIQIKDIDIDATGALFLVMELVVGKTLKQCTGWLREPRFVMSVLRQIAAGIKTIHAAGILHRDLKPANLLVADGEGDAPVVKIADFGLSSLLTASPQPGDDESADGTSMDAESEIDPLSDTQHKQESDKDKFTDTRSAPLPKENASIGMESMTQTGMLIGTPLYMAPELSSGPSRAKPSVDLFSFGVIAYELLIGKVPFAEPPVMMAMRGVRFIAPELSVLRPDLDRQLADTITRCLSDVPSERPTAAEVEATFLGTAP